jgi:23S rRNA (cytidine1920-2'-O)/16S rRNA (cytidine1409-2'-O)-methyltransferase
MRLDVYLHEKRFADSRNKAKILIEMRNVYVNGVTAVKPASEVTDSDYVEIKGEGLRYVSRGGMKLEAALQHFSVNCKGVVAADIGASTGGFTDCLLRFGARRVYAVDCGKNQLAPKLRRNPNVVSIENRNARSLDGTIIPERCDIVVMDVSFISQTLLYGAVANILSEDGCFISLIKPQFEAGLTHLNKHGIVTDPAVREKVVASVTEKARECGFTCGGVIDSPITGGDGNVEYLALFTFESVVN